MPGRTFEIENAVINADVGSPEDIANTALFLCSEKAGFITGENICIDGGITKLMICNDDHGWMYKP